MLFPIYVPGKMPIDRANERSKSICPSNACTIIEGKTAIKTIAIEVAMEFFKFNPKRTRAGTKNIPPPLASIPDKKPTTNPAKREK